jgi:AraC family ethanolamine operon transcriptional activator
LINWLLRYGRNPSLNCQTVILAQYLTGQHQKSFSVPMNTMQSPQLLLQQHYVDIDAWGREVGWDLEYQQIESGSARVSAYAFGTSHCIATRGEFSHSVRQTGSPPEGMITLGLPDDGIASFPWCGTHAQGGDIVNFSLKNGFEGTSPAGFSGFAISFSEELLKSTVERLELDTEVLQQIRQQAVWSSPGQFTRNLRHLLACILRDVKARESGVATELFNDGAASQILQFISGKTSCQSAGTLGQRRRAAQCALDWIERSESLNLTVTELCRHTGVSAPTLYRGFEEEFGIGPKRFMHIRRLTCVHKELLLASRSQSITDIANHWGFWHMGQFAADYRRQFDELPSQTRNQIFRAKLN